MYSGEAGGASDEKRGFRTQERMQAFLWWS